MIDDRVKTLYWTLLRAALWQSDAEPPVVEDAATAEALVRLHAQQGTGALVYPVMFNMPNVQEVLNEGYRTQMRGLCMQTMQQHVRLQHTLECAWRALMKAGLQPVLMKGAGLAALYPEPQLRSWGDIDLFVGKKQYHPACAVMRETFPKALKFDEELDHYKHYNLIADEVSIEVHRVTVGLQHPIDVRRYERMEAYGVEHACDLEIGDLRLKIFEPTFNALFVMLHAWEHGMTKGANVRQIADLTLLLDRYTKRIDRTLLRRWLNQLHLMDVWQIYMWIAVERLGLPASEAPFYDNGEGLKVRGERFIQDMLSGALVPYTIHHTPYTSNRFARKWHTMQERLQNARRIAQYSPAYARHMKMETLLHGALRLFAKDRHWE